jgi:hypothetical protein
LSFSGKSCSWQPSRGGRILGWGRAIRFTCLNIRISEREPTPQRRPRQEGIRNQGRFCRFVAGV